MANHPNRSWRATLARQSDELGDDLITAWMNTQGGVPVEDLARQLGERFSRSYDGNALLRWRRGARPVPGPVAAYMRREVLAYLLGETGLSLAKLLEPRAK